VSSSLIGILAQRLLRRICPDCKKPHIPTKTELLQVGLDPANKEMSFFVGGGCDKCFDTGYRGRAGIYELLTMSDDIREMVYRKESAGAIKKAAIKGGMKTLRMDGARKAMSGITTIEEVLRVTQSDTM
jgi:general secretion pathway protein E